MADNNTAATKDTKGVANKWLKGIQSFYELDSRGLGVRSTLDGDKEIKARYFEIPTPAWFPDSFLRSLKRNSYIDMINSVSIIGSATSIKSANNGNSLDFYQETNSGTIEGMVKNAAKSVLSYATNQIVSVTSKVDSLVSSVESFLGTETSENASLYKSIQDTANNPFLANQPYMTVYGIHMTESMRDTISTLQTIIGVVANEFGKKLWETFKSAASMDFKNASSTISSIFDSIKDKAAKAIKSFMLKGGENLEWDALIEKLFNEDDMRMHSIAEVMLDSGISGTYTMKCKLPYYGNEMPIMKSYGENGFTKMGIGNGHLKENGKGSAILGGIRRITGMDGVWSTPVEWYPEKGEVDFSPVNMSFHIFNDTLEHTLLNLFFIWSFGATTKAVTDAFFVRSPYIYNIEVPGGFRYKYCVCQFSVHPMGKLRRISSHKGTNDGAISILFNNIFKYNVNPNAIEYVPDFYKVDISFASILPDMWNFMDSYLHNSDLDKVKLGSHIQTKISKFLNSFK